MVLLIQTLSKYIDQMSLSGRSAASPQIPSTNNTSIGLVVKKYWHKIVALQSQVHSLKSEVCIAHIQKVETEEKANSTVQAFLCFISII